MAIANYYEQKPLIIFTFKKLCNGEQRLAAQHFYRWLNRQTDRRAIGRLTDRQTIRWADGRANSEEIVRFNNNVQLSELE